MKIDIYTHILPAKYKKVFFKYSDKFPVEKKLAEKFIALTNQEARFRIIDEFEDMAQVLTATMPPLEEIVGPEEAAELARIANDEMAELVARYPKKYVAAVANLPLNNMNAAVKEAERAIKELGFKGVQIYTSIQGKPLSLEEFMPLYETMSGFDLPIWIHPLRGSVPDYPTENGSFHKISSVFGWPYETTAAITRLVFAGIFEKFPTIKFITHHGGGMIPYFAHRIIVHYRNSLVDLRGQKFFPGLTKPPIEYFRMFYADTALNGNTPGLILAYAFFGEDHLLFGSDTPYDFEKGAVRETVEAIEGMDIPESSKKKIYESNAKSLLHLY